MDKIIVTGANGFIGSHLVNALLHHTSYEIIAVDLHDGLYVPYHFSDPRLKYVRADHFLNQLEYYKEADCLFHLGAISSTTETDWAKINLYNIYFSKVLIDFFCSNKVLIVYTSSASLYGNNISFGISNIGDIHSLYAYSKLVTDNYIQAKLNLDKTCKISCIRLFNVYGENEGHKRNQASPFYKFQQQALQYQQISIFENSGDYLRDFIPVDDVISVMISMLFDPKYGVYNLGTGVARSFLSVAQQIANIHQAELKWIKMPECLKAHYQIYTKADHDNILEFINKKTL